ncbi:hypothetical protein GQ588_06815 [Dehalobacter restrictus]|jgi:hypothetical protein|uniref:Uncharacterized protein n=2 Tax=Dehalobacter restrictus TaxID=55583 RepID=A0A857DGE4_9FIRM|nr:hypothetical protein DEHRE_06545 [Dehalobacter restrictus DSM 9455]QHA00364.1 hypothetical protein GQ588_06815 [Dehalobacter restrictus]
MLELLWPRIADTVDILPFLRSDRNFIDDLMFINFVKAVKDLLDKKEPDNLDLHNMEM